MVSFWAILEVFDFLEPDFNGVILTKLEPKPWIAFTPTVKQQESRNLSYFRSKGTQEKMFLMFAWFLAIVMPQAAFIAQPWIIRILPLTAGEYFLSLEPAFLPLHFYPNMYAKARWQRADLTTWGGGGRIIDFQVHDACIPILVHITKHVLQSVQTSLEHCSVPQKSFRTKQSTFIKNVFLLPKVAFWAFFGNCKMKIEFL